MKFEILSINEFDNFAINDEQSTFHQYSKWAKLKEINLWNSHYVGVKDNKGKILAASLILSKKIPFINKNMFYSPRGFIIDYKNTKLLKFFTENVKKYIKNKKGIFLKIDPYVIYNKRDKNGNIIDNTKTNKTAVENLKKLGYKHFGFNLYQETLQPRWMFRLELNGNNDEILKNTDPKTRQIIRKNEREGLKIRELKYDEINTFKDIMLNTSERRNFIDRPLSYYQDIYKSFNNSNEIKFIIAYLDLDYKTKILNEELKAKESIVKEKDKQLETNQRINIKKTKNLIEELSNEIKSLKNKIKETEDLLSKKGKQVITSGILYIIHGNEVLSLFGGTYKEYMNTLSPYTINYEMIKFANSNNYKYYNFYGITGDFSNENELNGLYLFKKGFNGNVIELIGEFDLIINKFWYICYKFGYASYRFIKKAIKK